MENARFWPEMILSGFLYVLGLVFIIFNWLDVFDLSVFLLIIDYSIPISAALIGASYLLGFLAHRAIPILILEPSRKLLRYLSLKTNSPKFLRILYRTFFPQTIYHSVLGSNDEDALHLRIKTYQFGSRRLLQELDQQFSWVALLKSLLFGLPFFGFPFLQWLSNISEPTFVTKLSWTIVAIEAVVFVSVLEQRNNFVKLQLEAYKNIDSFIDDA